LINKNTLDNPYLDVIISGSIPPNPAELLSNGRFEKLLNIVKAEYDYIIVDSAPTLLVTDTLLITDLSDLVIYVTRSDMTDKHVVEYSRDLHLQGKSIKVIENIEKCTSLKVLYLYDNQIEIIENLEFASTLQYLQLQCNEIIQKRLLERIYLNIFYTFYTFAHFYKHIRHIFLFNIRLICFLFAI
jgi:cellulose biosynthesis protein BcsQ